MRRSYIALSAFAFAVLAFAAVWLGGLNQDEGWYLYAAGLVGEGRMPYRDFFYTQGPLMPCVYSAFSWTWRVGGLLGARILTCLIGLASMILFAAAARIVAPPVATTPQNQPYDNHLNDCDQLWACRQRV